jgi:LEA14-like dessication related protein
MKHRAYCVAVVAPVLAMLAGCASMRPQVESIDLRVTGIDLEGVDLAFDVDVNNQMPLDISGLRGNYAIDIAEVEFIQSDAVPEIALPGGQTNTVTLPARMEYMKLWQTYENMRDAKDVPYALRGALICPVAGQDLELPLAHTGTLPVLRVPRIRVTDVRTSDVSLTNATVTVEAEMTNPNSFELGIDEMGYRLMLGDADVGRLTGSTGDAIQPDGQGQLSLTGNITARSALGALIRGVKPDAVDLVPVGRLQTPYGPVELNR